MSLDYDDLMALARGLRDGLGAPLGGASRDVQARAVISRAYYAVFIGTRSYLEHQQGFARARNQPHAGVIEKSPGPLKARLKRLRDKRNLADYDELFSCTDSEIKLVLDQAEHIQRWLQRAMNRS